MSFYQPATENGVFVSMCICSIICMIIRSNIFIFSDYGAPHISNPHLRFKKREPLWKLFYFLIPCNYVTVETGSRDF